MQNKTPQAAQKAQRLKESRFQSRHLLEKLGLNGASPTDPQGSYTGRPAAGGTPVQDADDL